MSKSKKELNPPGQLSLWEGSRNYVSHTPQQEKDLAQKMIDISGRTVLKQLESLSRISAFSKTFTALLIGQGDWYSKRCRLIWKLKGTKFNRLYFQLRVLTRPTGEKESGLLPTSSKRPDYAIILLPTPLCKDTNQGDLKKVDERRARAKAKWINGNGFGFTLGELAKRGLLPTPTTRDWKGANSMEHLNRKEKSEGNSHQDQLPNYIKLTTGSNSQLNPRFVAEMMGFPVDWLELPFQNGETNQLKD